MTEEKKEPWVNQMALATVVLAVGATLSTFKGGSFSTASVINQTLASDQWAFYQAKSTKQHLYILQIDQMNLQAMSAPESSAARAAYDKKIKQYQDEAARYESEKKLIEAKARDLEGLRDEAKLHGRPFGIAVIFLQVAILLNSIAGLLKNKQIWWLSVPVGLTGLVFFGNGFFSFF